MKLLGRNLDLTLPPHESPPLFHREEMEISLLSDTHLHLVVMGQVPLHDLRFAVHVVRQRFQQELPLDFDHGRRLGWERISAQSAR